MLEQQEISITTLANGAAEKAFQRSWPLIWSAFHHPERAEDQERAVLTLSLEFERLESGQLRALVGPPALKLPTTRKKSGMVHLPEEGEAVVEVDLDEQAEEQVPLFPPPRPAEDIIITRAGSLREEPATLATLALGEVEAVFLAAFRQLRAAFLEPDRAGKKGSIKLPIKFELMARSTLAVSVGDPTIKFPALRTVRGLLRMTADGRGLVDLDEVEDGARALPFPRQDTPHRVQ